VLPSCDEQWIPLDKPCVPCEDPIQCSLITNTIAVLDIRNHGSPYYLVFLGMNVRAIGPTHIHERKKVFVKGLACSSIRM
jgi:hypothetical protein